MGVRVYRYFLGVWSQLGGDINGDSAFYSFGKSVSLSSDGTRVAVGAHNADVNGVNSGQVQVFDLKLGLIYYWEQVGGDISDGELYDNTGDSVSISSDGSRVAVGTPYQDGGGQSTGRVQVYELIGGSWTQLAGNIDGENTYNYSGRSVALSADGSIVATGAQSNDGNGFVDSGHARVFKLDSTTECKNALLTIYLDDGTVLPSCVEARNLGYCETSTEVQSHCPNQCGTCLLYRCSDSLAKINPTGATCALLAGAPQSTIDYYCGFNGLFKTCRELCEYCEY